MPRYSDKSFWSKVKRYAKVIGKPVLEKALWLYYAMQREDCPGWAKAVIIGALAYFILPIDAIPDYIPGVGYVDDLATITTAIGMVAQYIDSKVKKQARGKVKDLFG